MKRHFLLLLLIIFALPIQAQKTKDALYLKNGSIIYGKLLEISDNQYKIRTADGSIFIYPGTEVEKLTQELPGFEGRKPSGPGIALECGLLVGSQENQFEAPFSFNFIVNYTSNIKNIVGIGSGVEYLGSGFTPVYLEYKHLFTERKTSPFIFMRGGALFHLGQDKEEDYQYVNNYEKDYKGGAMFTSGIGISWAREDSETYLSFAYRYAQTSYSQLNYNDIRYTYKNYFNRLEVKIGFRF
ncbi:MAG: hypothetical protein HPY62_03990 [Bacteroidales bacterium]|nr:hypothetical protein [Bacteroidales bacterium]